MRRHPWEITLRELIEKVWRDFGIEVDEDVILPLPLLRLLCRAFGLPPEHFHLDPEEEDD